jgi:hypothetical protein
MATMGLMQVKVKALLAYIIRFARLSRLSRSEVYFRTALIYTFRNITEMLSEYESAVTSSQRFP